MRPAVDLSLYVVLDVETTHRASLPELARAVVAGGATVLQVRDKRGSGREFLATVRAVMTAVDVPVIVNDRVDIALAAGAVGAHVGQDDLPAADARALLGPDRLLGLSVTCSGEIGTVDPAVVDHVGLGPVFATSTKSDAAPPLGLAAFTEVRRVLKLPVVAIGGIAASNAGDVIAAGADGIVVVSAVAKASDPRAGAAELARIVQASRRIAA